MSRYWLGDAPEAGPARGWDADPDADPPARAPMTHRGRKRIAEVLLRRRIPGPRPPGDDE